MTDAANAMFPAMSQTTESPPAVTAQTEPEAPRPRTDDEIAQIMFRPEVTYREPLRALGRLSEVHGLSAEEMAVAHTSGAHLFAALDVPVPQAAEWSDLISRYSTGADDAQAASWLGETTTRLREKYGADADARLTETNALLDRFPGFKQLLTTTRLGNHPTIVLALVERTPALRIKHGGDSR